MKASRLVTAVLVLSGLGLSAMAQQNPPAATTQGVPQAISPEQSQAIIEKVVKHCVDVVHQYPAHNELTIGTNPNFFKNFDAFYNPATQRVENNGYLNGDIPAQYQFNKCMASQGFPLK
jgi:hypothetical protein